MNILKLSVAFLLIVVLPNSCQQLDKQRPLNSMQNLSEKTGIEMVVIDEAQKITKANAFQLTRHFNATIFVDDPIKSSIRQETPNTKTVELPGISFLVNYAIIETLIDTLNRRLSYRQYIAFISDDDTRDDEKQTLSIIHAPDKYNILRFQEISGGSDNYSTDSLILKLRALDEKYPFDFIGVGRDWCLLRFKSDPMDYLDFAKSIASVCPPEEQADPSTQAYAKLIADCAKSFKEDFMKKKRTVSMWWD